VWSLEATLWAVLTGTCLPLVRLDWAPDPPPRLDVAPVLAALRSVAQECVAADIQGRPTASEVAERLRGWLDGTERRERASERLDSSHGDREATTQETSEAAW
jgi:hypothetical protein